MQPVTFQIPAAEAFVNQDCCLGGPFSAGSPFVAAALTVVAAVAAFVVAAATAAIVVAASAAAVAFEAVPSTFLAHSGRGGNK